MTNKIPALSVSELLDAMIEIMNNDQCEDDAETDATLNILINNFSAEYRLPTCWSKAVKSGVNLSDFHTNGAAPEEIIAILGNASMFLDQVSVQLSSLEEATRIIEKYDIQGCFNAEESSCLAALSQLCDEVLEKDSKISRVIDAALTNPLLISKEFLPNSSR